MPKTINMFIGSNYLHLTVNTWLVVSVAYLFFFCLLLITIITFNRTVIASNNKIQLHKYKYEMFKVIKYFFLLNIVDDNNSNKSYNKSSVGGNKIAIDICITYIYRRILKSMISNECYSFTCTHI